jgi:hypothetical protein
LFAQPFAAVTIKLPYTHGKTGQFMNLPHDLTPCTQTHDDQF